MPYRQHRIVPNSVFSRILSSLVLNVYIMWFFHFSQETQLTRHSMWNFFTIFNLHFPFLAHILLLLQHTFLPSKLFNFGFIKYNKTVFNLLHHFSEVRRRT